MPGYGLIDRSARIAALASFANVDILSPFSRSNRICRPETSDLTPEQDAFVQKVVEAGEYQNASEAVRDALRALQQRRREDALRLKVLRMQIAAGADELERGDFVEVDAQDLEAYLDGLTAGAAADSR